MNTLRTIASQQSLIAPAQPLSPLGSMVVQKSSAPWVEPPENFEGFDLVQAILTPDVGSGDLVVLAYAVPRGYDGVIKGLLHNYVGSGFQQGAGGIVWRLAVNGRWVRHYDSMLVTFGSPEYPRPIAGVRIYENQVISYVVNVAGGNGLLYSKETQIVCGISGWLWPRRAVQS